MFNFKQLGQQLSTEANAEISEKLKWYALLSWSEYHNLESAPIQCAFDLDPNRLNNDSSPLDQIYGPLDAAEVKKLINAFRDLCEADWTPNQSSKDREENSIISRESHSIIYSSPLWEP